MEAFHFERGEGIVGVFVGPCQIKISTESVEDELLGLLCWQTAIHSLHDRMLGGPKVLTPEHLPWLNHKVNVLLRCVFKKHLSRDR